MANSSLKNCFLFLVMMVPSHLVAKAGMREAIQKLSTYTLTNKEKQRLKNIAQSAGIVVGSLLVFGTGVVGYLIYEKCHKVVSIETQSPPPAPAQPAADYKPKRLLVIADKSEAIAQKPEQPALIVSPSDLNRSRLKQVNLKPVNNDEHPLAEKPIQKLTELEEKMAVSKANRGAIFNSQGEQKTLDK